MSTLASILNITLSCLRCAALTNVFYYGTCLAGTPFPGLLLSARQNLAAKIFPFGAKAQTRVQTVDSLPGQEAAVCNETQ